MAKNNLIRSLERRLDKVEREERELIEDYKTLKGYLYIITGVVFILFIGYFILLRWIMH